RYPHSGFCNLRGAKKLMEEEPKSKSKTIIWNIVFTLMYPFITVFSLLFTGILSVFSFLSWVVVSIIKKFK
ncbi:MAG: hypothetical protein NWQ46_07730, partial [Spirosomaceae bacterium]|nr:hypothetical protein [Spirosomataceae bacterium]